MMASFLLPNLNIRRGADTLNSAPRINVDPKVLLLWEIAMGMLPDEKCGIARFENRAEKSQISFEIFGVLLHQVFKSHSSTIGGGCGNLHWSACLNLPTLGVYVHQLVDGGR
ncbi:hypothetical protein [Ralstonia solanacearum]|uniref:hypothetical protein n=1 Tax=Ralstonia solanacearum TaxID=305 RepID=UPI0018C26595|nr:hypothetical protein [Ralstonia solanacearum]